MLNREKVEPDDVFFIPAGRIHTIGKGLLIAEIQQTSTLPTEFMILTGSMNGNKRELHNELAVDAIDFEIDSYKTNYDPTSKEQIIGASNYFITKRRRIEETTTLISIMPPLLC